MNDFWILRLILLIYYGSRIIESFFVNSTYGYFGGTRNISCRIFSTVYPPLHPYNNSLSNATISVNMTSSLEHNYCSIYHLSHTLQNGSVISETVAGIIDNANILEHFVRSRCSSARFSPSISPISHGTCTRLPHERFTATLCVCSTINCNADY